MDPISIATMALQSIGKVLGGVFDFFGAQAKAKAEYNAGQQALAESGVAGDIALRQGNAAEAHGAVEAAASGGGVTGSALDAINAAGVAAMFNARSAAYRGETENQARVYQGNVDKAQGWGSLIGGIASAGGTALSAFGQAVDKGRLAAAPSGSLASGAASAGGDGSGAAYNAFAGGG